MLSAVLPVFANGDVSLDALNAKAYGLFLNGKYEESLDLYNNAINMHSSYAPFYDGIGLIHLKQNNSHQALTYFNKAKELDKNNVTYKLHSQNAILSSIIDTIKQTDLYFHRAISYSNNPTIIENINKKQNNDFKKLELLTDTYTTVKDINIKKGNKFIANNEIDKAIEQYQYAIKNGHNKHRASNNLGVLYLNQGNYKKSEDAFLKALSYNSKAAYIYNNLGVLYASTSQFDLAQHHYNKGLKLIPKYSNINNNIAVSSIKKALKNIDKNIASIENILKNEPQNVYAKLTLGKFYILNKDYKKAQEILFSATKQIQYNPEIYSVYADSLFLGGEFEKSIEAYDKHLSINKGSSLALLQIAKAQEKLGNNEEAESYYQKSINLNKNNYHAYLSFGNFLLKQNRKQEAYNYYKIYTKKASQTPEAVIINKRLKN